VESGKEWIQSILSGVAARPLIAPKNKRPGCGPGLHSKLFTDLAVVTVMMTVVVTDSGIGRNGGAGQDGDCDGCEQEIAEELHAVWILCKPSRSCAAARNCLQHTSRIPAEK
jgi:hypothetical protein